MSLQSMLRRLDDLQARANLIKSDQLIVIQSGPSQEVGPEDMAKYRGNPVLYAKEKLGITMWDKVGEAITALHHPPYRVACRSGHKIGKSNSAGALINYWFDVYDPGVVITTGASYEAMEDTVWSEVRMQRMRAGRPDLFIGPVAPELRTSREHWAKLISVNKPESFQGKHRGRILFIFDEAVGVDRSMFTIAQTMFKPEPGFAWICFYNPTDLSSPMYAEEQSLSWDGSPKWKIFTLSSLEHPNVVKQMEYRKRGVELTSSVLPIPNAISITQIDQWVKDWCLPIDERSMLSTDFRWYWPDGSYSCWRPQMDWEARCTGNWPSQATSSVWSHHLFEIVANSCGAVPIHLLPELGCDVARFGDDKSTIHARWGSLSLYHGARQGLRTTETTGWLIDTAREMAKMATAMRAQERGGRPAVDEHEIPMKVDDDGIGGSVVDQLFEQGYNVIPVRAGTNASDPTRYPNKRSELWFSTVRRALNSGMAFCTSVQQPDGSKKAISRLDTDTVQRLKLQAVAPTWKMDSAGRRVVEPKADTKKRLGRSPDDMDAVNLAYYEAGWEAPQILDVPVYDKPHLGPQDEKPGNFEETRPPEDRSSRRRKLFGQR